MTQIVAHRGASATHPENTLAAFEAARHQGASGVELDVRRTANEVLVVHHDAHLADGRLILELEPETTPEWLPTLGEVLDVCAGMWVNVEIKNPPEDPDYDAENAISLAVAGLLTAHILGESGLDETMSDADKFAERVVVSSFNVSSVLRIKEINPAIPTGLLVWGQIDPPSLIARAVDNDFDAIHPHDILVDAAFVARARDAGLAINVWTVDDPARIVELATLGVDGIITNAPDRACAALKKAGLA